jgi:hypothetical protein
MLGNQLLVGSVVIDAEFGRGPQFDTSQLQLGEG